MKSKQLRNLCALLASVMLLGTLASCATANETEETDSQAATMADHGESDSVVETETEVKDDLPDDIHFAGEEIVFISNYREGWTSGEISVEKITGDEVNDAVFERNKQIEERLGVTFTNIAEHEPNPNDYTNKVVTVIQAGTHEYDLMSAPCYTALNHSLSGVFRDMRELEYIGFDKPWWSQGFNEVVEYRGAQYAMTGSMLLSMYRFAFVTVFNKEMFTDHNIPHLYEDVDNGSWTLDRQIELVPVFHIDAGTQGTQDENDDTFGLVSNDYIGVDPYWSSCQVDILRKNGEGDYELVFDANKLHSVAEKVLALFYETGGAVYNYKHEGNDDEQTYIREMFAREGAAMATLRVLELESATVRNMSSEYGVIPMPKFDEAQAEYRTLLHDWFTVVCVPTTIQEGRFQMMGAVLEAMSSDSYYRLRPAYYESTLRTKIAQDPESAEMMDLIMNHIYIDAGIIYTQALSDFHHTFRSLCGNGNNTVISDYKKVSKQVSQRTLPKMLDKLQALKDSE